MGFILINLVVNEMPFSSRTVKKSLDAISRTLKHLVIDSDPSTFQCDLLLTLRSMHSLCGVNANRMVPTDLGCGTMPSFFVKRDL